MVVLSIQFLSEQSRPFFNICSDIVIDRLVPLRTNIIIDKACVLAHQVLFRAKTSIWNRTLTRNDGLKFIKGILKLPITDERPL